MAKKTCHTDFFPPTAFGMLIAIILYFSSGQNLLAQSNAEEKQLSLAYEALRNEEFSQAEQAFTEIIDRSSNNADTAIRALIGRGVSNQEMAKFADAERDLVGAVQLTKGKSQLSLATNALSFLALGRFYIETARYNLGKENCSIALEITSELADTNSETTSILSKVCIAKYTSHFDENYSAALTVLLDAEKTTTVISALSPLEHARLHMEIASALGHLNNFSETTQEARTAKEICEQQLSRMSMCWAENQMHWSELYQLQKQNVEGLAEIAEAEKIIRSTVGTMHPLYAKALIRRSIMLAGLNYFDEVSRNSLEAISILKKAYVDIDYPEMADAYQLHALAMYSSKNYKQAERDIGRALKIRRAALGKNHSVTKSTERMLQQAKTLDAKSDQKNSP